uniref:Translation elongation factor EFTu-like domain-containing protein n=1 Tax=Pavo cristatus TaxID=9049 RepID=A0A8C9G3J7_PAVCR
MKLFQIITVFIADQGSGFCVTGKIEAGYIQVGERLLAMPPNETCTAKGITLHDEPVDWAAAGDHVSLTLTGMDIIKINVGCVFCDPKEPVKVCTRFRARILIFNIEIPVTKGFPVSLSESYFHCKLLGSFPFHVLSHVSNVRSHLVSRIVSLPPRETDSAAT